MANKYALFILTYKRPNKQITIKTLDKSGYTGKIYLLCGEDDPCLDEYKEIYGDQVKTFHKQDYLHRVDRMTNEVKYNAVVYARMAVFDVAKKMGLDYIIIMDDDYSVFNFSIDSTAFYKRTKVKDMDRIVKAHFRFLAKSKIANVSFAQGGDFIGGWNGRILKTGFRPLRKSMNVFFCKVSEPIVFNGMTNEDSTMGIQEAVDGRVLLTNTLVQLEQSNTQQVEGGLTDIYKEEGTYQKSFYTILASPSSVKAMYQRAVGRVHHIINANLSYPKIVSGDLKKREKL